MAQLRVAAILRAGKFSPNHIANDAAILHAVAACLRRRGCEVNVYTETEFLDSRPDEDLVLAMCREPESLEKLQRIEDEGTMVVNSAYGIENCIPALMMPLLADAGIPVPESYVVDTDVDVRRKLEKAGFKSCRVRRADTHMHHLEDKCRCRHPEETQEILHEFFFRGIRKAVVSRETEGEIVRFYGIRSTGWFHSFMPFRDVPEDLTCEPGHPDPLESKMKEICMQAAGALGVDIFGGDMTVSPDGECMIVSFDDWPSFAPIRNEAAKAIARSVTERLRKRNPKRKKS